MIANLYTEITKSMTLTKEQFSDLVEQYSEQIVDGMDMDTLVQFAIDSLIAEYTKYSAEEIIAEIREIYDDEIATDMIESVGANPKDFL